MIDLNELDELMDDLRSYSGDLEILREDYRHKSALYLDTCNQIRKLIAVPGLDPIDANTEVLPVNPFGTVPQETAEVVLGPLCTTKKQPTKATSSTAKKSMWTPERRKAMSKKIKAYWKKKGSK